jgi:lipopolysaccharide export system protein LptC
MVASRSAAPPVVPVVASRALTLAGGLLATLLAFVVGGWGLWRLMSVERAAATPHPPAPTASARGPELVIQGVHMVEAKDGGKLWEVRADKAEVFERDGVTHLRQVGEPVEVVLYSAEGTLTAIAREAIIDMKSKDVTLQGDVRGRSDRGTDLRTASLHWVAATRLLHTQDEVVLTRGGLVSVGKGMEAETNLERVRVLGGISSQVAPAPAAGPAPAGPPWGGSGRARGTGRG